MAGREFGRNERSVTGAILLPVTTMSQRGASTRSGPDERGPAAWSAVYLAIIQGTTLWEVHRMKSQSGDGWTQSRRHVLKHSVAASAAISFPWIVPARVLGRAESAAASERITLGVIGIGPRCTYDLRSILNLPDVQCVAICDVQASRREAGTG